MNLMAEPCGWPTARVLAGASVVGVALFVILVAVLHVTDASDPIETTISEYVLGEHGWLLTGAALALGLTIVALAVVADLVGPRSRRRAGTAALALGGLGMVAVGAFPTDPIDPTAPRFVTTDGAIHAVAGILSFTCIAVAAPLLTPRLAMHLRTPGLRRATWLPPIGYAVFWATGIFDEQFGGLFGRRSATGLGERLMAVAYLSWLLSLAIAVLRARHSSGQ